MLKCGVSTPVVCCLPKAEKRVRFSYPALKIMAQPENKSHHGEGVSGKEIPRHISLVQLPAVGKIAGIDVRFAMHTSPGLYVVNFLHKNATGKDVSLEGRVYSPDFFAYVRQDSRFQFLDKTWLQSLRDTEESFDAILYARNVTQPLVSEIQAAVWLSEPFAPGTVMNAAENHEVGFFPVDALKFEESAQNDFMLRGCNEFRLGSDTLPQAELDALAQRLALELMTMETDAARSIPIPPDAINQIFKLQPSYLTEQQ